MIFEVHMKLGARRQLEDRNDWVARTGQEGGVGCVLDGGWVSQQIGRIRWRGQNHQDQGDQPTHSRGPKCQAASQEQEQEDDPGLPRQP